MPRLPGHQLRGNGTRADLHSAAAGDLTAARTHYQASLDIRERLAAIDPVNVQWQRDLEYVRRKLKELPEAG